MAVPEHTSESGLVKQIGQKVVWGTSNSEAYGYITSISLTIGANTQEYKNFEGIVKTLVVYDPHKEFSMNVTIFTNQTLPAIGDKYEFQLIGDDGTPGEKVSTYITSASVNYQNEAAASMTLGCRTYTFTDKV